MATAVLTQLIFPIFYIHLMKPGDSTVAVKLMDMAYMLYDAVVDRARTLHPVVASGIFGADMKLHLVNDGPVTIPITLR